VGNLITQETGNSRLWYPWQLLFVHIVWNINLNSICGNRKKKIWDVSRM